MTVSLRRFRWWDIEPVVALENDLFAGDDPWSAELFWSELAQRESRHYVVADDHGVVGYAGLAVLGDEGWVQTIGVRRDRWGEGIGRLLLDDLLAAGLEMGTRSTWLEVRADNERATALYTAYGFEPVGLRRRYYRQSGADAVVMRRR